MNITSKQTKRLRRHYIRIITHNIIWTVNYFPQNAMCDYSLGFGVTTEASNGDNIKSNKHFNRAVELIKESSGFNIKESEILTSFINDSWNLPLKDIKNIIKKALQKT